MRCKEQNDKQSREAYKPPYKLTSDAHRKDRGQLGKGTKEMMVWEQVCEWVGGLSLDGGF